MQMFLVGHDVLILPISYYKDLLLRPQFYRSCSSQDLDCKYQVSRTEWLLCGTSGINSIACVLHAQVKHEQLIMRCELN